MSTTSNQQHLPHQLHRIVPDPAAVGLLGDDELDADGCLSTAQQQRVDARWLRPEPAPGFDSLGLGGVDSHWLLVQGGFTLTAASRTVVGLARLQRPKSASLICARSADLRSLTSPRKQGSTAPISGPTRPAARWSACTRWSGSRRHWMWSQGCCWRAWGCRGSRRNEARCHATTGIASPQWQLNLRTRPF